MHCHRRAHNRCRSRPLRRLVAVAEQPRFARSWAHSVSSKSRPGDETFRQIAANIVFAAVTRIAIPPATRGQESDAIVRFQCNFCFLAHGPLLTISARDDRLIDGAMQPAMQAP